MQSTRLPQSCQKWQTDITTACCTPVQCTRSTKRPPPSTWRKYCSRMKTYKIIYSSTYDFVKTVMFSSVLSPRLVENGVNQRTNIVS